jgi:4-nitrophenyl phosphatase
MVLAVIVGMDRQITYDKLRRATMLIRSGVPFIGTNPDKTFPTPEGLVPGTGALIAALEAATSIQPIIVGKPSPEMYLVAMERMGSSPATTVVVGDRLETDIAGGQQLGCKTGLVLSGVTNIKAAQSWVPSPDWIEPDLTALLARL